MAPSQADKMMEIFKATLLKNFFKLDSDAIEKMIKDEYLPDNFLAFVVERIGLDNTLIEPAEVDQKQKKNPGRQLSKQQLVKLLLTNVDEFNKQRPPGKIDLRGITINKKIAGADLSDADLTGTLWKAEDFGCGVMGCANVNFTRAILRGCVIEYFLWFNGSNFSNAILDEITIDEEDVAFHGCIFTGSNASEQEFFKDRTKDALRGCIW